MEQDGKGMKKSVQEQQKEQQAGISAPEAEKGQDGAENKVSWASEEYIIGVDMAADEIPTPQLIDEELAEKMYGVLKQQAAAQQGIKMEVLYEEQTGTTAIDAIIARLNEMISKEAERRKIDMWQLEGQWEILRRAILKAGETLKEVFQEWYDIAKLILEKMYKAYAVYTSECLPDKWQIEKMLMSNNERRRKGIPMVRRQAHLQNERNSRKRRRKK